MRFALVIVYFCVVVGCSVKSSYPEGWPSRQTVIEDQCPDISGTYKNLDTDTLHSRRTSLFDMLKTPLMCKRYDNFNGAVKIEWSDESKQEFSLQLQEQNGDPKIAKIFNKEQGDFLCENGVIKIDFAIYIN